MNHIEKIRAKWSRGEVCVGAAVSLTDATVSELYGEAGCDFVWIEVEHSAVTLTHALNHVRACRAAGTAPFIRVPSNDPTVVKPFLELHPAGIIIPRIENVDDAEQAIRSCRYPPRGVRGYGPSRGVRFGLIDQSDYLEQVDDQIMVMLQIEHIDAVNSIDAILDLPGVDSVLTGPNDLAATMGLGPTHPDAVAAIERVYAAAVAKGIPVGQPTGSTDPEVIGHWVELGVSWISVGVDWITLANQTKQNLDKIRGVING